MTASEFISQRPRDGSSMTEKNGQDAGADPDTVRSCLNRVTRTQAFVSSPRISRFLEFIVEAKLAGDASRLKAYTIGVKVFDRPPDFDPESDSIVRVSAIRLRRMLDLHYAGEGREYPIRIQLPKGTYVPSFANTGAAWSMGACSPDRILVVVKNLKRIGGFPEEDYIVCGLTEELVSNLSGYGENMIAVRAPVAASGNAAVSVSSLAFNPCIVYKLRGNVRLHGDEIRVCVRLIESETGVVTWSQTFSYRLSSSSLFDIQEQVGRKVASTVLDPHGVLYRSLKRKPPAMLGTYLAVFRYHEYQEHFSPETHLRARHELENAVRQEPDYADAWAALANVCLGEALFGFNQTRPLKFLIGKCVETARKAIALDSRNVIANYILAMTLFYRKDKAQFLMMAEHALRLAPHRPDNLAVIGMHLALAGEWERGLARVEEAMGLNPFHPCWYYLVFSLHHLHSGRYQEALASISRFACVDFFPFQINLAVIHGHLGNRPEARRHLRRMFELWPEARHRMDEIIHFWFPFQNLAAVFEKGLSKASFRRSGRLAATPDKPDLLATG